MNNKTIHNPKESQARSKLIEDIALFYESHGIPRIGGRIIGLLLLTEGAISAEQIASRLKVSRGSISSNVRSLMNFGLIEKISEPGNRLNYYCFSPTAWENVLTMRLKAFIPLQQLAKHGLSILPHNDTSRPRLEELIEWAQLYQEYNEKLLEKWHESHG